MKKIKLALLGCGFLSEIVANAVKDGYLPEYQLIAVLGRNTVKTKEFAERHHCDACTNITDFMSLKPDFVAEAASGDAIRDYSESILDGGANLVVLSIGAFADHAFYERIKKAATRNGRRVYFASGAVGGFDILRTAALMSAVTSSISSQQSASSLQNTPLFTDELLDISTPEEVFRGSAKEAIAILPTRVNIAVATALACGKVEDTAMSIHAVPGFVGNEYKIALEGEEVRTELNIYSRTSAVAGWSVVAVLQNAVSPIVF